MTSSRAGQRLFVRRADLFGDIDFPDQCLRLEIAHIGLVRTTSTTGSPSGSQRRESYCR
jgi:hypothetical protein